MRVLIAAAGVLLSNLACEQGFEKLKTSLGDLRVADPKPEMKLGSTVRLNVERGGKTIDVQFRIPSKRPEVQGY